MGKITIYAKIYKLEIPYFYMKPEKEFEWIVKLLNSRYLKGGILKFNGGGCKSDFEREVGASENNKEFRKWLEMLIEKGILEFFEKREVGSFGKAVDTYVVVYPKLEELLIANRLYTPTRKIFEKKSIFGLAK